MCIAVLVTNVLISIVVTIIIVSSSSITVVVVVVVVALVSYWYDFVSSCWHFHHCLAI